MKNSLTWEKIFQYFFVIFFLCGALAVFSLSRTESISDNDEDCSSRFTGKIVFCVEENEWKFYTNIRYTQKIYIFLHRREKVAIPYWKNYEELENAEEEVVNKRDLWRVRR